MKSVLLVLLMMPSLILAQSSSSFFEKADSFFAKNVENGLVNYKAIKADPVVLNELVDMVSKIDVANEKASTYQSFYINAYNILVIKGIVDNYPVNSPLKINGFFDSKRYVVSGKKLTLNDIENKKLRAVYPKEARFHFVLVCAGLGCPPIINEAYKPATLEVQMQRQTEIALNNPKFIRVEGNKVRLSQIFEWYKKDFTQYGSYIEFINKYRKEPFAPKTKTSFYTYNWELNEVK